MNYIVIVACLAVVRGCPIPDGYRVEAKLNSKQECINTAKQIIHSLGYNSNEFRIVCREK